MSIFIPLIFPVIGFILQIYIRIFNRSFGVDVWTRLLEADHIRKAGHKIPGRIAGQFIIEGYFDYPPIFPFLLSFFKKKTIEKFQGLVAPFFDSLNNLLIFWVAFYFTNDFRIGLLAQAIYTFTPLVVLENSSLTPRSLGYLNFNLAFLSSLIYTQTNSFTYLLLSILFTTLIFLSHRFAMQALLFISVFFSLYNQNYFFIGVFLLGFILALIVTKGYYLRVLKGHLYNIYFWIPNRQYRFAHQVRSSIDTGKKQDFVEIVYIMLSKLAPISLLATNFWVISAFIIIAIQLFGFSFLNMEIPYYINLFTEWTIFFYILCIPILMISYLRCIGEGYRYLEMITLPASIVSSWLFFQFLNTDYSYLSTIVFFTLLIFGFLLIIYSHRKIIKDRNRSITPQMESVFNFLNKQKEIFRIICIPHQNTINVLYHTKHEVFVNADNKGLLSIIGVYPVIKWPLQDTIKKYNLNLIFLKESFAKIRELKLKKYKEMFRSGDIVLLKV